MFSLFGLDVVILCAYVNSQLPLTSKPFCYRLGLDAQSNISFDDFISHFKEVEVSRIFQSFFLIISQAFKSLKCVYAEKG